MIQLGKGFAYADAIRCEQWLGQLTGGRTSQRLLLEGFQVAKSQLTSGQPLCQAESITHRHEVVKFSWEKLTTS